MSRIIGTGMLMLFATAMLARESTVQCKILDDGIEKIQCTLVTPRKNETRSATFYWHSETFPQDDRERDLSLPANHGSVYDYRYLRGRAEGAWTVTVTVTDADGKETEASYPFSLENGEIVGGRR
jgi:hypothetical protein